MRRKLLALLIAVGLAVGTTLAATPDASACHKDKAHGQQEEINLDPVQEEPVFCGSVL